MSRFQQSIAAAARGDGDLVPVCSGSWPATCPTSRRKCWEKAVVERNGSLFCRSHDPEREMTEFEKLQPHEHPGGC